MDSPDQPRITLSLENISKSFRKTKAIDDISFEVPAASLTVLLGPAGAGKTTTLRTVAGLERPDYGSVFIENQDVTDLEPRQRDIAMIFDNLALYPNKSGYKNIASPLEIKGEHPESIKERVSEIAAKLQISPILTRLPNTMSGGERQRIALGRALIRSPRLFLLDEPLSSLDAKLRTELRAELKRLQRELGYTFLMATPDFIEALAIADTVVMLRQGKIIQIASPQELYDNPADLETASFVGAPPINLIKAAISFTGGVTELQIGGSQIPMPKDLKFPDNRLPPSFTLGIRPENLQATSTQNADIIGVLADIEPLGRKSVITVKNETTSLRLLLKSAEAAKQYVGESIGLKLVNYEKLLCFDPLSGTRLY